MNQPRSRRAVLGMFGAAPVAAAGLLSTRDTAAVEPALAARIQEITGRPELAGARWGMRFQLHGSGVPVYALNPGGHFNPASAVKALIAGAAFSALGPDHRFRTRVHRTGPSAMASSTVTWSWWPAATSCSARASGRTARSPCPTRTTPTAAPPNRCQVTHSGSSATSPGGCGTTASGG